MEIVVLDGTEYMKASVAAKEFKYTSDYIGQLCRAKKIDAKLVGRTWFVNPTSVAEHKANKYSSMRADDEREEKNSTDIASKIKDVSPVLKSKTAKSLPTNSSTYDASRVLRVNYESDEESLIPKINKRQEGEGKTIRVKAYGAKNLNVTGGVAQNTTNYTADELPNVALSGKLSISSYPDEEVEIEEGSKEVTPIENRPKNKQFSVKRDDTKVIKTEEKARVNQTTHSNRLNLKKKPINKPQELKFSPTSVADSVAKPVSISAGVLASPLIASILAILCVGLLFSASSNAIVTSNSYQGGVTLQVANLLEILTQ